MMQNAIIQNIIEVKRSPDCSGTSGGSIGSSSSSKPSRHDSSICTICLGSEKNIIFLSKLMVVGVQRLIKNSFSGLPVEHSLSGMSGQAQM